MCSDALVDDSIRSDSRLYLPRRQESELKRDQRNNNIDPSSKTQWQFLSRHNHYFKFFRLRSPTSCRGYPVTLEIQNINNAFRKSRALSEPINSGCRSCVDDFGSVVNESLRMRLSREMKLALLLVHLWSWCVAKHHSDPFSQSESHRDPIDDQRIPTGILRQTWSRRLAALEGNGFCLCSLWRCHWECAVGRENSPLSPKFRAEISKRSEMSSMVFDECASDSYFSSFTLFSHIQSHERFAINALLGSNR